MQRGSSKFLFSYDASGNVVSVKFNGTEYYYLRNAQGDIVKLIDASGATVVEYIYNTWGKKVTTTGSLAGTLGLFQPFRYRGYVYDWETGFYYLQSRYYDPTTGRFISADVLLSTGQGVLGHNAYAYCLDNPANKRDAVGCDAEDLTLADYRNIHNMVRDAVAMHTCGEVVRNDTIEVFVKHGKMRGFIDVYVRSNNTYYEVKSMHEFLANPGGRVTKQLSKYAFIFEKTNSLMQPGTDSTIQGTLTYKGRIIRYRYIAPGQVAYTIIDVKPQEAPAPAFDKVEESAYGRSYAPAYSGGGLDPSTAGYLMMAFCIGMSCCGRFGRTLMEY